METTKAVLAVAFNQAFMLAINFVLILLTAAALRLLRLQAVGTTLAWPWYWSAAAAAALALAASALELSGSAWPESTRSLLRYLAGLVTLAPHLALLGARRPQDAAWQWIVAALLAVFALPALAQRVYRPGGILELEAVWRWFLLALVAVGVADHFPTRRAPAAVLFCVAQWCWLGDQWPLLDGFPLPHRETWGLAAAASALWLATYAPNRAQRQPRDRLWLDFRDAFGTLWALRLAEQFNASARIVGWKTRLTWRGFGLFDDTTNMADADLGVDQALENLLRRFVSPEWIERRSEQST